MGLLASCEVCPAQDIFGPPSYFYKQNDSIFVKSGLVFGSSAVVDAYTKAQSDVRYLFKDSTNIPYKNNPANNFTGLLQQNTINGIANFTSYNDTAFIVISPARNLNISTWAQQIDTSNFRVRFTAVTGMPIFAITNNIGVPSFQLDSNQNIGFNTASPNITGYSTDHRVFTVRGTGSSAGHIELSTTASILSNNAFLGSVDFGNNNTTIARVVAKSSLTAGTSGDLVFFTTNAGTSTESLRLNYLGALTGTNNYDITWATNVTAGLQRGTVDTDLTRLALRDGDGVLWYLTISTLGVVTTSTTAP